MINLIHQTIMFQN